MVLDLICVGDINTDITAKINRMPRSGGEAIVTRINQQPGGSAANVAVAGLRLGLRSGLVAIVGDDALADALVDELSNLGVGTSMVLRRNGQTTGMAFVAIDSRGQRTIFNLKGANGSLDKEDVRAEYVASTRFLYVSGFTLLTIRQTRATLAALKCAEDNEVSTIIDVRMPNGLRNLHRLRIHANFVTCTVEAFNVIGKVLKNMSKDYLMVYSRENRSSRLYDAGNQKIIPAFPARVRNLLGANDAMIAGFIYGISRRLPAAKSALLGMACKALVGSRVNPVLWEAFPDANTLMRYFEDKHANPFRS